MSLFYHWLWHLVPANPIFLRVLHGESMRARHMWARWIYLGALTLLIWIGLMSSSISDREVSLTELAKNGASIFALVSQGQVVLICLLAPIFMAGAINEEQAGETFDILLTTPLTNLQIVLGSLLSRLFFVWVLLASGLPLFAVLLMFGGVPIASVFIAFAIAALAGLLVGSVAIFLSVLRTGGRRAVYTFMICVAGYLVASYAVDKVMRLMQARAPVAAVASAGTSPAPSNPNDPNNPNPFNRIEPPDAPDANGAIAAQGLGAGQTTWVTPLHPLLVLEAYVNTANYKSPTPEDLPGRSSWVVFYLTNPLGAFACLTVGLSTCLTLWSAIRLRAYEGGGVTGGGESGVVKWMRKKLNLAGPGDDKRRAPRNVWHNPIAWREANARGRGLIHILSKWSFTLVAVGLGALWLGLYHFDQLPAIGKREEVFRNGLLTLLWIELSVIVLVAVYMSAGAVSKEREDGTLDLMLTTPITPHKYIWGKLRGLVSFLSILIAAPVATLALVALYSLVGQIAGAPWAMVKYGVAAPGGGAATMVGPLLFPEAALLLPIMLVPFVAMCATIGMYWSIRTNGVMGSITSTILIVAAYSGVLGFCFWRMAENVPVVGPIVNCFSPVTNLMALVNPWGLKDFDNDVGGGRAVLVMGAMISAAAYVAIVFGMIQGMVRGFDQTVRKLSGANA